jgi:hypothetical protein
MNGKASQRGGMALLLALTLLVIMTAAALGASRDVVRELSLCGDGLQGDLAACAADAGVDWFLAWCSGDGPGRELLPGVPWRFPAEGGDVAIPGELGGAPGIGQAFDLRATCLGPVPASGGGARERPDWLWQVIVRGRAKVRGGGLLPGAAQALRELLVVVPSRDGAGLEGAVFPEPAGGLGAGSGDRVGPAGGVQAHGREGGASLRRLRIWAWRPVW